MINKTNTLLNKLYITEKRRILFSLFMTIVFFITMYCNSKIVFFINDDENIMYTLAGYYTYGNTADHSFINGILSLFLQYLYTIIPSLPWYGLFHLFVLFFSITIIGKTILKECFSNDVPILGGIVCFVSTCILLYIYPVILMQFTTTSALAGTAAIASLFCADNFADKKSVVIQDYILSFILLILCYMHRKNTGYIVLCFYTLIAVYKILYSFYKSKQGILEYKNIAKRTFQIWIIGLASVLTITLISQNILRNTPMWDSFYSYDEARFKMTDYPHDTFSSNEELYEEIDWSESLYNIAGTYFWFFMDERINEETFEKVSETGYYDYSKFNFNEIINRAIELFKTELSATVALAFLLILFIVTLFLSIKKKKLFDALLICCTLSGTFFMCLYLCWKGRFILRAFQVIIFSALIILMLVFIKNYPVKRNIIKSIHIVKQYLIFLGVVIFTFYFGIHIFWKAGYEAMLRKEKSLRTIQVEEYAIGHPENFYIYDTSLTFRYLPFTTYENHYPSNLMFWGGMGWKSPAFYEQLRLNNLMDLNSDVFFDENVYYISYDGFDSGYDCTVKELFMNYMNETYGEVSIEIVDIIDKDIIVYKISP